MSASSSECTCLYCRTEPRKIYACKCCSAMLFYVNGIWRKSTTTKRILVNQFFCWNIETSPISVYCSECESVIGRMSKRDEDIVRFNMNYITETFLHQE